jgi:hypothetical protein
MPHEPEEKVRNRRLIEARSWAIVTVIAMLNAATPVRAQYFYPYSYGPWGWQGWGYSNPLAEYARGLGYFAMGQGIYNQETAVARSINVNTAMRLNEYVYQSSLNQGRRYHERKARESADNIATYAAIQDRLRDNPTQADLYSGDALNMALDELSDPRYAYHVSKAATAKVDGSLIRNIPFRNAVEAVTFCLADVGDRRPPEVFQGPAFADDVRTWRTTVQQINKEAEDTGKVSRESVRKLRDVLKSANEKLKTLPNLSAQARLEGERHIRALLGLSYMLDGPSLDIYLAGVENRHDVTLAKLMDFMQSFNLRFGSAQNPSQREAYSTLYPLLVGLRKIVFADGTGTLPSNPPILADGRDRPGEFFGGMRTEELDPEVNRQKAAAPAP